MVSSQEVSIEHDRYLTQWLKKNACAIVISSYKAGAALTLSNFNVDGNELTGLYINNFHRLTGLCYERDNLWMAANNNILKLNNIGPISENKHDFDHCFIPKELRFVSDIDLHDLSINSETNQIYFVSTLYNCIGCLDQTDSSKLFQVYWLPPWIDKVVGEDRCHLNGLTFRDGVPRYVTSCSESNIISGWRDNRKAGGIVYDLVENRVVCRGLSMPHSPRWHANRLWLLDSGSGYFGYIDENEQFVRKTFIPGFLRGLAFLGTQYALIGASQDRHENVFMGLELGETLKKNNTTAKCGLYIVNLNTFAIAHSYIFTQGITELYDVALIPLNGRCRMIDFMDNLLNTINKEITIWGGAPPPPLTPSPLIPSSPSVAP